MYSKIYERQVDPNVSLNNQVNSGKLAHQRRFYFWIEDLQCDLPTDDMVNLLLDDFTLGKKHKEIVAVSRTEDVLVLEFKDRLCYKFGKHKLGPMTLELLRKRDIDKKMADKKTKMWQSKWPNLK